jgi:hypothetical protein
LLALCTCLTCSASILSSVVDSMDADGDASVGGRLVGEGGRAVRSSISEMEAVRWRVEEPRST